MPNLREGNKEGPSRTMLPKRSPFSQKNIFPLIFITLYFGKTSLVCYLLIIIVDMLQYVKYCHKPPTPIAHQTCACQVYMYHI